ncbi:MAG: GDP-mannose 4,6-dehydratase [Candidatus Pelagibacter sp.]|nr:GDP-mannose 4,6-dehydratase [Candidatus Pelagibacter sp.]|tara:strand:+ start:322 stop:1356 length:1035 start_codon:yes stop_codon:yes gene_type:complete
MKKKIALIFGVTGQDGAYLSKFLLNKNYKVYGIKRRSSIINTQRIDDIYKDINYKSNFLLFYGDLTDSSSILNLIKKTKPDEIYNLGAQSHVQVSFEVPEYSAEVNGLGTLRILEAIRSLNYQKKVKFYQAGTSEMFGRTKEKFHNEKTPFYPASPYGVSKCFAHWITVNYREAYDIYACNGILFNHESPIRGETFVTKKIIQGLIRIKDGYQKKLFLGNLYAKRDWGHARDYVEVMWKMLQQKKPDDYVIGTGKTFTIKEFVNKAAKQIGFKIKWVGKGIGEKAINVENKKIIIECRKRYFRPVEVDYLKCNAQKAKKLLKWSPKISLDNLINEMIEYELQHL